MSVATAMKLATVDKLVEETSDSLPAVHVLQQIEQHLAAIRVRPSPVPAHSYAPGPVRALTVEEVARQLGVKPSRITQILYERWMQDELPRPGGGRRIIPADYVDMIASALRRKGIEVATKELES